MKNLTIYLLLAPVLFAGCEEDKVVGEAALPAAEKQYLDTHFPNVAISRVVRHRNDNMTTYDVWLQNRIEVEFDAHGRVAGIDGQATERLPDSVLPTPILEYVNTRYEGQYVVEWERERNDQEIRLFNGTELVFDLNGAFVRIDD
ncbi:PepSY-like domain-containing protein [Dyadobacter sp. 676]|uniref:PepSY-like domain-containing protein n=1 Tax=Dyadobacter sp. 676 TaxID=3088362 RepID=A0AAU8FHV6_9BACT